MVLCQRPAVAPLELGCACTADASSLCYSRWQEGGCLSLAYRLYLRADILGGFTGLFLSAPPSWWQDFGIM